MTGRHFARVAAIAFAFSPLAAQATDLPLSISGPGVSGNITISYIANPNTGPLGKIPNSFDPIGSYIITSVSGFFSDAKAGLVNAAVTGIAPVDSTTKATPEPTNFLAPNSFSLLPIQNGSNGSVPSPGYHYDNLFYPGGSPQTATDYPASGGLFDIYGLVFTLDGGIFVNLWSNGTFVPDAVPVDYGVGVTTAVQGIDYVEGGVNVTAVPEPASWALMLVGFGAAGAMMRARRRGSVTLRFG